MNGNQQPPVGVGETYEVSIDAVGEKGDGIAKVKGFVLFVPGVKKGDFVQIRVTKVLRNVGFAEVAKKLEERPARGPKYATVSQRELGEEEEPPDERYEDTEDFGTDLEEK